jgi:hypothetical protein
MGNLFSGNTFSFHFRKTSARDYQRRPLLALIQHREQVFRFKRGEILWSSFQWTPGPEPNEIPDQSTSSGAV